MWHLLADVVAPMDALLLKGDDDPTTRAIMTCVLVLDAAPETARLTRAFERASAAVPRMRQRVVRVSPQGRPRWAEDHRFDVRDHLREAGAPGDGSLAAVLSMASGTATAPFEPTRPLWDATIVTGMAGGQAVLLLRVHHAIADGVRALTMMAGLLDLEPDPGTDHVPTLRQQGSRLEAVRNGLVKKTAEALAAQQRFADAGAGLMIDATWRPMEVVADATGYVRSALRTYADVPATASPLLSARSRARQFMTLELPLSDLRGVAKANRATVNDVFLAGLLGGLAAYHRAFGQAIQDVPVAIPINVAGNASPESGNHFSAAVLPGPCSVDDPRERISAIHELVRSRRSEAGVDVPLRLAPLLHRAPAWIAGQAIKAYSRRVDLQASNIVGPDCPIYLAGREVERFHAFGPLPGIPVMAVLLSYHGTCTIGMTVDPAAVTDPGLLVGCTREAFGDLTHSIA